MSSLGSFERLPFYLALSAPLDSYHGFIAYLLPIVTIASQSFSSRKTKNVLKDVETQLCNTTKTFCN